MDASGNSTRWTEFQMEVPWGHVHGKWWGPRDVQPILALHGWQDNAGTFDLLIPMLPTHFSYLALDFPGHGFSSHYPEGMMIYNIDFVNVILMVVNRMNWDKVSILGHSMGGVMGFWLAAMFPDKVNLIIAIDTLKPPQIQKNTFWEDYGKKISKIQLIEKRAESADEPPSYTFEECIERLSTVRSVDKDKCKYILARNVKESVKYPGKYYFSRDERLKYMNKGIWPQDIYEAVASKIKIPHLYINALEAPLNEPIENFNKTISVLKQNPLFQFEEVDGRHHVHLNQPENVAGIISYFLSKYVEYSVKKAKL